MPTIHIHIPEHARALRWVSDALNEGFKVTIDLDEVSAGVPPTTESTSPTRAEVVSALAKYPATVRAFGVDNAVSWAAEEAAKEAGQNLLPATDRRPAETAKERIRAQRQEADLFSADRDQRHADQQARQEMHDARIRNVDEARRLVCPTCKAEADQRCLKASGQVYDWGFAHVARIRKARGY